MRWEAGGHEGGGDGGGAGKDREFDFLIAAGFEKTVAGIRETGSAGIGNDGDFFAALGTCDEFRNALFFVVIVERDEWARDFEVVEELARMAGVLAGDEVGLAESFDGADGDVTEVADGGGDEGDLWVEVGLRCHRLSGR